MAEIAVVALALLALAVMFQALAIRRMQTEWKAERQDLLNRIMASNWQEYKNSTASGSSPPPRGGNFLSGYRREMERIRGIAGGGS